MAFHNNKQEQGRVMDLLTQLDCRRKWAEDQAFKNYRAGNLERVRYYNDLAHRSGELMPSAYDYGGK